MREGSICRDRVGRVSIVDFASIGNYLTAYVKERKQSNSAFSFRSWSRQLNVCSPSLLTMIVRGERQPTLRFAEKLANRLKFSSAEKTYAIHLTNYERAKEKEDRHFHFEQLRKINPQVKRETLGEKKYELLDSCLHLVVLEMTKLKAFQANAQSIANQLGKGVTAEQVQKSIDLLKRFGLVSVDVGRGLAKSGSHVYALSKVPSFVFRGFHKQVLNAAFHALDHQPIDSRFVSSSIFPVPARKRERAIEMIKEFRDQFMQEISTDENDAEDVCFLGIQFFSALSK